MFDGWKYPILTWLYCWKMNALHNIDTCNYIEAPHCWSSENGEIEMNNLHKFVSSKCIISSGVFSS